MFSCDRSIVDTTSEALDIEGMQSSMGELHGDAGNIDHVALDASALRDFPFLTFTPVGSTSYRTVLNY